MTSTEKDTSTEIDWEVVALAETHPLRVSILKAIAASNEPLSPRGLATLLDKSLGDTNYHAKALVKHGFLVLDHEVPRRGAMEHYYRLAKKVVR